MKGSVTVEGAASSDAPAADDHGGPTAETGVAADPNARRRHVLTPSRPSDSTARCTTSTS